LAKNEKVIFGSFSFSVGLYSRPTLQQTDGNM